MLNDGDARARLATDAIASPHLVDSEVAHALRAQVRRGSIDVADGDRALRRWMQLGVQRFPVIGLLERVWELRANLTASDATYVAIVEALGCALLTADGRLGRAPGPACPVTIIRS